METYDYSKETGYINKLESQIDTLHEKEARQVSELLNIFRDNTKHEQCAKSLKWFDSAILPVLRDFAETTCSRLTLERPDDTETIAT